jgi:hypothetical protein
VAKLVALLPKFTAGERIYPYNARIFRRELTSMLAFLGINDERFDAYSFRRGSASYFFKKTGSLDMTTLRGRWSHEKTARNYIEQAASIVVDSELSERSIEILVHFSKIASRAVRWVGLREWCLIWLTIG